MISLIRKNRVVRKQLQRKSPARNFLVAKYAGWKRYFKTSKFTLTLFSVANFGVGFVLVSTLAFLEASPALAARSVTASASASAATQKKFPYVSELVGKVTLTDREGKTAAPKKNQVLIEKAALETGPGGQVTIQLDANRRVQLLSGTRLEFPAISWESGAAPILVLKHGSVRWRQPSKGTYNIALTSELQEFMPPEGDYVFSFDPGTATAEVKVIEGKIEFSAMHAEETAEVSAGQKCKFQGVKENGEIVYDVLLKGKKIPRGQLGKVLPFSDEEKRAYSGASLKKEVEAQARREHAEKIAAAKSKDPLQICAAPGGRLNQCAWVCKGNPAKEKKSCRLGTPGVSCVRTRCNANGDWAEATEVPGDKAAALCWAAPQVKECDY